MMNHSNGACHFDKLRKYLFEIDRYKTELCVHSKNNSSKPGLSSFSDLGSFSGSYQSLLNLGGSPRDNNTKITVNPNTMWSHFYADISVTIFHMPIKLCTLNCC